MAGNSKIIYYGTVLLDLTDDTVTPDKLVSGVTAHSSDGSLITGTASVSYDSSTETMVMPSGFITVS